MLEHNQLYLKENTQKIISYINELLPNAHLISNFNGNIIFQVSMQGLQVSKLFYSIDNKKKELSIQDWGISQPTLEDVFLNIVNSEISDASDEGNV